MWRWIDRISPDVTHASDLHVTEVTGDIDPAAPVHPTRVCVAHSIDGFGLSPGLTEQQLSILKS